jgi:siroheme synthase
LELSQDGHDHAQRAIECFFATSFRSLIILVESQQIVKTITQLIPHGKSRVTSCQIIFQEKVSNVPFLGRFIVEMPCK